MNAVHRCFELRPSHSCETSLNISPQDVEAMLPVARQFLSLAGEIAPSKEDF